MPRKNSKLKYTIEIFSILKKYGLSINMDDIAKELRLTKKTLYNNYENKDDMLNEVMTYFFKTVEEKILLVFKNSDNAIDCLFKSSAIVTQEISLLGKVLIRDISEYKGYSKFFNHTDRTSFYSKLIRQNLEQGIQEKMYRDDIDLHYSTLFFTSAIEKFYKWEGRFVYFEDSVNFQKELAKYHLYSITNAKGRKILEAYI